MVAIDERARRGVEGPGKAASAGGLRQSVGRFQRSDHDERQEEVTGCRAALAGDTQGGEKRQPSHRGEHVAAAFEGGTKHGLCEEKDPHGDEGEETDAR